MLNNPKIGLKKDPILLQEFDEIPEQKPSILFKCAECQHNLFSNLDILVHERENQKNTLDIDKKTHLTIRSGSRGEKHTPKTPKLIKFATKNDVELNTLFYKHRFENQNYSKEYEI